MKPAVRLWVLPALTGLGLIGLWYFTRYGVGVSEWLLPTPGEILRAAWTERVRLLVAAGNTALGALGGFAAAAGVGLFMALVVGGSRSLRASLYPWLLMLQMTPVIVLTPIVVLWVGPGLPGIITVTFLISFFPIVVNTTQGLLSADANMVDLFRMGNATRLQEVLLLRVPAAMPYYLAGLRIAATLAPIGAIFGEYLVGNSAGRGGGLGFLVYVYNTQIRIPALFATALTSCLLGFIFVAAVSWLNWAALHQWHDSFERKDR
ncbi:MAG: ABC transporter permease subunit [Opitutae bacterium]|nr:ABC transporter permease subunit [Opitutae bacterium]